MSLILVSEYKMKQIEDTLRLVSNFMDSSKKETCIDRQVCKSLDFSRESLNQKNKIEGINPASGNMPTQIRINCHEEGKKSKQLTYSLESIEDLKK